MKKSLETQALAISRRQYLNYSLAGMASGAGLFASSASLAQKQATAAVWPELKVFIPANPGGGWDQTGRSLGGALQAAGFVDKVVYENLGGKAGIVGLPQFVERYKGDPNALMVGGMVMLGGIAIHRPAVDLSRVTPIAELTSDYPVVVVPANSPVKTAKDLLASMKEPGFKATVVGGSAGGVDHMLLGMLLRSTGASPEAMTYLATAGGADAIKALGNGQAQIGISGYSEFREAIQAGSLRPLAVSSRRGEFGLPSLRESGFDAVLVNWRGVFGAPGISNEQREALIQLVTRGVQSAEWKAILKTNNWQNTFMSGEAFRQFVETEQTLARVVVHVLKLKA